MSKNRRIAFVFPNTHYAMEAEDILAQGNLEPNLLPLSSDLGLGCGTAVSVAEGKEKTAKNLLLKNHIPVLSMWIVESGKVWKKYS